MKLIVLLVAFAAVCSAETAGCDCPDLVHAVSNGMDVFASPGDGSVSLAPCCEDILKYKKQIAKGGFKSKHTPGGACGGLKSCGSCTVLAFCRWHVNGLEAQPSTYGVTGCVDESSISDLDAGEYTHECALNDRFEGAELRRDLDREPFVQKVALSDKGTINVSPRIAFHPTDWPADYEGYLPPAGCAGLHNKDLAAKYPSGVPGCGDYVNEGTSGKAGHMTTDIVSDPRLPVETHKPKYPLGANSQLPDDVAQHGGDFQFPQKSQGWVKPLYNHNGCVGGPCDEASQHSCTGLSCSHIVVNGDEHHEDVHGSVYKHTTKPKL